jgi:hypothetical protein
VSLLDWNKRHALASALLVACPIVLLLLLGVAFVRWHDIKGTYFINSAALARTNGRITVADIFCRNNKAGLNYHYSIRYEFWVDGKRYESEQVTFSYTGTTDRTFAEGYTNKYPVGKNVTVFYEEGNPSFSVLEPEKKDDGLLNFFLVGLILDVILLIWAAFNFFRTPFYD